MLEQHKIDPTVLILLLAASLAILAVPLVDLLSGRGRTRQDDPWNRSKKNLTYQDIVD